jgi:hypothetical protein
VVFQNIPDLGQLTRAMPTCALVNQDCVRIPLITQAHIQPNSKEIITLENYPPLEVVDKASQEVNTYNES